MSAPDATNNTYLLEVDGSSCYTVGGSSIPLYGSGATTFFSNNTSNWTSKNTIGTNIDYNFTTTGTHTIKLIGNAPNVIVDRLVMTQDLNCTPTGTGDNCANPVDTTPPVVSITSPADGTSVSGNTNIIANATDDTAVTKVEFYVDSVLTGTVTTQTNNNFTYALNPAGLASGSHSLTAKAYDAANNVTTSSSRSITKAGVTYQAADINQDGHINFLDLSILASKYGQSGAGIGRSDINGDGSVNFLDLSILASKYGTI